MQGNQTVMSCSICSVSPLPRASLPPHEQRNVFFYSKNFSIFPVRFSSTPIAVVIEFFLFVLQWKIQYRASETVPKQTFIVTYRGVGARRKHITQNDNAAAACPILVFSLALMVMARKVLHPTLTPQLTIDTEDDNGVKKMA